MGKRRQIQHPYLLLPFGYLEIQSIHLLAHPSSIHLYAYGQYGVIRVRETSSKSPLISRQYTTSSFARIGPLHCSGLMAHNPKLPRQSLINKTNSNNTPYQTYWLLLGISSLRKLQTELKKLEFFYRQEGKKKDMFFGLMQ